MIKSFKSPPVAGVDKTRLSPGHGQNKRSGVVVVFIRRSFDRARWRRGGGRAASCGPFGLFKGLKKGGTMWRTASHRVRLHQIKR